MTDPVAVAVDANGADRGPAEVARGTYMQNPPGLAALKLMHLLIAKAGGRMGEDVEHRVRLSEVRGVEGLRNHDRASLAPLFAELQAAVLIHDDTETARPSWRPVRRGS